MSANYYDGRSAFGSQKALVTAPTGDTSGYTATTYVFKSIELPMYDAKRVTGGDEVGNEDSQWFTGVIPDGTAVMQFPNTNVVAPPQYSTVPLKPRNAATALTFIIYSLGETFEAGGETMMKVKIARQMNPPVAPADPQPGN